MSGAVLNFTEIVGETGCWRFNLTLRPNEASASSQIGLRMVRIATKQSPPNAFEPKLGAPVSSDHLGQSFVIYSTSSLMLSYCPVFRIERSAVVERGMVSTMKRIFKMKN